jgi:hypothetical protein
VSKRLTRGGKGYWFEVDCIGHHRQHVLFHSSAILQEPGNGMGMSE